MIFRFYTFIKLKQTGKLYTRPSIILQQERVHITHDVKTTLIYTKLKRCHFCMVSFHDLHAGWMWNAVVLVAFDCSYHLRVCQLRQIKCCHTGTGVANKGSFLPRHSSLTRSQPTRSSTVSIMSDIEAVTLLDCLGHF